jgi:hypothetical protein
MSNLIGTYKDEDGCILKISKAIDVTSEMGGSLKIVFQDQNPDLVVEGRYLFLTGAKAASIAFIGYYRDDSRLASIVEAFSGEVPQFASCNEINVIGVRTIALEGKEPEMEQAKTRTFKRS